MPLLGFPHCQPLRAIDWLTGCSFGTFHLPLIPWLPDGPLFLSRPALPLRSTAILKYCKKENRIFFFYSWKACWNFSSYFMPILRVSLWVPGPKSLAPKHFQLFLRLSNGRPVRLDLAEIWQSGSHTASSLPPFLLLGWDVGKRNGRVS